MGKTSETIGTAEPGGSGSGTDATKPRRRREARPGVRWTCPGCGRSVILYVPCLMATCTRCGRRMVKGEVVEKKATA
jgi:ribosomal protein S27E